MPNHSKVVNLTSFKGLNNVGSPENTDQTYLKKALNVNIDKTGNISKRKGYTKVDTANYTSLWASENNLGCYAVRNGELVKLDETYDPIVLRSNIPSDELSFEEVDNTIYYSSISTNGTIEDGIDRPWGIPKNNLSPNLSISIGSLPAGTYQVSFTYVTSDYKEGGTGVSSVITVPSGSSITLQIPNNPNYIYARVYCSTPNGNTLYYSGIGILGSSYSISSTSDLINPIRTFNIDSAPLGQIVKYYRGRLYIAQGNILWYSEPYQYDYFRMDSNFFEFPEKIVEVMPVEDGIWIGSDRLYYLSGESPEKFKRSTKEHIKVIGGTATKVSGSYIHMDNTPIGYKWVASSDLGIWVLFNQGMCINTTSSNVELDSADSGTSLFMRDGGMNQYLSILKTNQNPNNSVVGDLVETSIVRNGITII